MLKIFITFVIFISFPATELPECSATVLAHGGGVEVLLFNLRVVVLVALGLTLTVRLVVEDLKYFAINEKV